MRSYSEYMKPYVALLDKVKLSKDADKETDGDRDSPLRFTVAEVRELLGALESYVYDENHDRKYLSRVLATELFAQRAGKYVGSFDDPGSDQVKEVAAKAWEHARAAWEAKPEDM